jgi:hypothetical protein
VEARAFARTTGQAVVGAPSRQPEPVYGALQWLEAILTKPPAGIETTGHTANSEANGIMEAVGEWYHRILRNQDSPNMIWNTNVTFASEIMQSIQNATGHWKPAYTLQIGEGYQPQPAGTTPTQVHSSDSEARGETDDERLEPSVSRGTSPEVTRPPPDERCSKRFRCKNPHFPSESDSSTSLRPTLRRRRRVELREQQPDRLLTTPRPQQRLAGDHPNAQPQEHEVRFNRTNSNLLNVRPKPSLSRGTLTEVERPPSEERSHKRARSGNARSPACSSGSDSNPSSRPTLRRRRRAMLRDPEDHRAPNETQPCQCPTGQASPGKTAGLERTNLTVSGASKRNSTQRRTALTSTRGTCRMKSCVAAQRNPRINSP